jgi:5-methylcytosine-specific restriction endonuclease McrA
MRDYRRRRLDDMRAYHREYARAHYTSKTYRRLRGEWGYLLRDPCSYCGGTAGEVDHIIPRSKGGSEDWDNLTATCRSCNARKRTIPLLTFLLRRAAA